MNQQETYDYVLHFLKIFYNQEKIKHNEKYIIAEGTIPICLIAHLDTVFEHPKPDLITKDIIITTNNQGLGADDKAGIYMILKIISSSTQKPHIIFTTDEERNAKGAFSLIKNYDKFPFDCKFLIELDRRGKDQCVFYNCRNLDFINYICSFGYKYNKGTFSDILILGEAWNIASVNLSVGYYNEHTLYEYLNLTDLDFSLKKVIKILQDKNSSYFKAS